MNREEYEELRNDILTTMHTSSIINPSKSIDYDFIFDLVCDLEELDRLMNIPYNEEKVERGLYGKE